MPSFEQDALWSPGEPDERLAQEYQQRAQQYQESLEALKARSHKLSMLRLFCFAAAVVLGLGSLGVSQATLFWGLAAAALSLFLILVVVQAQLENRIESLKVGEAYFRHALARFDGSWRELSAPPTFVDESNSLFAQDLDIFGPQSLFHFICRAQSYLGRSTLAQWMLNQPEISQIHARRQAIAELQTKLEFLVELYTAARSSQDKADARWLLEYFQSFQSHTPLSEEKGSSWRPLIIAALVLFQFGAVTYLIYQYTLGQINPFAFVGVFALAHVWHRIFARPLLDSNQHESARPQLRAIARAFQVIEDSDFQDPSLGKFRAALLPNEASPATPSQARASQEVFGFVQRWDLYQAGKQGAFSIIAYPFLWNIVFGEALWSRGLRLADSIAKYFESLGNIEALASLAAYARENPQYVFPTVDDQSHSPIILAQGLRHILLDREHAVPNPVSIRCAQETPDPKAPSEDDTPQIVVLSGSNMSGKSTYLRSIGLAIVLARLGAPVPARSFRCTNWRLGACLRSDDSIQRGMSRFYAEIDKLGRCVTELRKPEPTPFLFLFDEIFHGTNSHDRRIAVRGLLAELLTHDCAGWITTHDLALSSIASEYAPKIQNQHFEDQFDQELMSFDYRLRPGVVQKSNALALMRHVGLLSSAEEQEEQRAR